MIDSLVTASQYLLHGDVILFLVLGSIIGLIFGALPGLGGTTALAVMIPFTYGWDPNVAMFFFAALMGAVPFGGSTSAILLRTPGTPVNAATCFDGYPMTQKGQGGKAIGISATASGLGAMFGVVVLIALIPAIRPIILAFRPPEFFMLVLLGLTTVAFAAKGNMLKGLISGGIGVFLSLVGFSQVFGGLRFTFGSEYLWDGFELVPFLIGVFAVAEMFNLMVKRGSIVEGGVGRLTGVLDGAREVFKHPLTFFRSSAIGTIIGIIPGVGGTVANFLSYVVAKQTSKHPETFGTGDPEGVLAAEAANNAKDGGALLPTVAFGIPGSAEMAVLLGAFILHGLQPGPLLIRNNMGIVWALILGLVFSNIFASTTGLVGGGYLARLTKIRVAYIVPIVLLLCFAGSYALRENILDVVVTLVAGIFGYGLIRFGFSTVCLVIGLVLGVIAEKAMMQSLQISYGSYSIFFTRPISLVIFLIVVGVLVAPLFMRIRANARNKAR